MVVESTPRKTAMVVITAIASIGKKHVGLGVIANPVLAALSLGQLIAFTTQTTVSTRGHKRKRTAAGARPGLSWWWQARASRLHNCQNRQVMSLSVTISCVSVTHPVFVPMPPACCFSRAERFVSRRSDRTVRTASPKARGWPMITTNCLPRVTPV